MTGNVDIKAGAEINRIGLRAGQSFFRPTKHDRRGSSVRWGIFINVL